MNHEEITQNNVVEKYVLGELGKEEVHNFEAHLFSCKTCYEDVRNTQIILHQVHELAHEQLEPEKTTIWETLLNYVYAFQWKPVLAIALIIAAIYLIPGLHQPHMLETDMQHGAINMRDSLLIENNTTTPIVIQPNTELVLNVKLQEITEPTVGSVVIYDRDLNQVWSQENTSLEPNALLTIDLQATELQPSEYTLNIISQENEILLNRVFAVQFK